MTDQPQPKTYLYVFDLADGSSVLGACHLEDESEDCSPKANIDGSVVVMKPIRGSFGVAQTPQGPQMSFNVRPVSNMDWIDVMFVKPQSYYLAGEHVARVYENAVKAFRKDYDASKVAPSGIHLASEVSSADLAVAGFGGKVH
jgi:hypothetical protein